RAVGWFQCGRCRVRGAVSFRRFAPMPIVEGIMNALAKSISVRCKPALSALKAVSNPSNYSNPASKNSPARRYQLLARQPFSPIAVAAPAFFGFWRQHHRAPSQPKGKNLRLARQRRPTGDKMASGPPPRRLLVRLRLRFEKG